MNANDGSEPRKKVEKFLRNLELLLEDVELKLRHGIEIETYFDTSDVRNALVGMYAFYDPVIDDITESRMEDFSSSGALVRALGVGGWLGPIRMLAPHKAELVGLLNLQFGLPVGPRRQDAERFVAVVDRAHEGVADLFSAQSIPTEELARLIETRRGVAETLFKIVQCIHGTWQSRLTKMTENGWLVLNRTVAEYAPIFAMPEFALLKKAFDKQRPRSLVNNMADAAALCLLLRRVDAAASRRSNHLPCFFASSKLFYQVLDETGIRLPDDQRRELLGAKRDYSPHSVLRGAEYFVLHAMFFPPEAVISMVPPERRPSLPDLSDLADLRGQIQAIRTGGEALTPQVVGRLKLSGKSLADLLDELHELSFLEYVWAPSFAATDLRTAISSFERHVAELAQNTEFRRHLEEAIQGIKRELAHDAGVFIRARTLWINLSGLSELEIPAGAAAGIPRQPSAANRTLALLRFSFPESIYSEVQKILDGLESNDENERDAARGLLMAKWHAGQSSVQSAANDLMVAAAVLWSLELDEALEDLLRRIRPLRPYSLLIVYGAVVTRTRRGDFEQRWGNVVRELEAVLRTGRMRGPEKVRIGVGLAYLYFHRLLVTGFIPEWREALSARGAAGTEEQAVLKSRAVACAREAYDGLREASNARDRSLMVYALNIYLYYAVECLDALTAEVNEAAMKLLEIKQNQREAFWHYRYDDTLARYHHRRSTSANEQEGRAQLLETAFRFIESSSRDANHLDEKVESYRAELLNELTRAQE